MTDHFEAAVTKARAVYLATTLPPRDLSLDWTEILRAATDDLIRDRVAGLPAARAPSGSSFPSFVEVNDELVRRDALLNTLLNVEVPRG